MTGIRKQFLQSDGIDVEKIEQTANKIFTEFSDMGLSIKEAEVVIGELGCILQKVKKRSPDTILKTIQDC